MLSSSDSYSQYFLSIIVGFNGNVIDKVSVFLDSLIPQLNEHCELILVAWKYTFDPVSIMARRILNMSNIRLVSVLHEHDWNINVARNRGAAVSLGEYLFFTDIDVEFQDGFINSFIETLRHVNRNNPLAVVYPRVMDRDTYLSMAKLLPAFETYCALYDHEIHNDYQFAIFNHSGDWRAEGYPALHREVFQIVGQFNEGFTSYGRNKQEFCFRLFLHCLQHIVFLDKAIFHRSHPPSTYRVDWANNAITYWAVDQIFTDAISKFTKSFLQERISVLDDAFCSNYLHSSESFNRLRLEKGQIITVGILQNKRNVYKLLSNGDFIQSTCSSGKVLENNQYDVLHVVGIGIERILTGHIDAKIPVILDLTGQDVEISSSNININVDLYLVSTWHMAVQLNQSGIRKRKIFITSSYINLEDQLALVYRILLAYNR